MLTKAYIKLAIGDITLDIAKKADRCKEDTLRYLDRIQLVDEYKSSSCKLYRNLTMFRAQGALMRYFVYGELSKAGMQAFNSIKIV